MSALVTFSVGLTRPGYDAGTCSTHCSLSISNGKSGSEGAMPKVRDVPASSVFSVGLYRRLSWFSWNSRGLELSALEIGLWPGMGVEFVAMTPDLVGIVTIMKDSSRCGEGKQEVYQALVTGSC